VTPVGEASVIFLERLNNGMNQANVIPAKAGIHDMQQTPPFAGVTIFSEIGMTKC
jgi:hypothetical protein